MYYAGNFEKHSSSLGLREISWLAIDLRCLPTLHFHRHQEEGRLSSPSMLEANLSRHWTSPGRMLGEETGTI